MARTQPRSWGASARPIRLSGAALPFSDGLLVVASDTTVVSLDRAGRRLWEAVEAGCTEDDLINASVEHGGLPFEMARAHISGALDSWRALGLIGPPDRDAAATPVAGPVLHRDPGYAPVLDAVYLAGDRPVRVRCDDAALGAVIEAACRSCRVPDAAGGPVAVIDVIAQDRGLAVIAEQALLTRAEAVTSNRALARHRCLTALLETARPAQRWLGILHASAVALDGRCVVFPGARGASKSTLGAALAAAGAEFVTDDYAPLEQATWHVWPVPYAPGIKRGSWRPLRRYYPDLDEQPVCELAGCHIRYLPTGSLRMAPLGRGLPVEAVVFPRFDPGAGLDLRRISATEAFLELCHASSMLDRRPELLAETLRWIESVPAYRLIYGDLHRAVERLLRLRLT